MTQPTACNPESPANPETHTRLYDLFIESRDHANQWDVSGIWHVPSDSKAALIDWDVLLAEVAG